MRVLVCSIVLLCAATNCASFKENIKDPERQRILGWTFGMAALGAFLGAVIPDRNKDTWSVGGAALGGSLGAVGSTLFVEKRDRDADTKFLESFINGNGSAAERNKNVTFQVVPKDLPKEIKDSLIAPTLKKGKTSWFELDGRIYAPTYWFEYNEGTLRVPKLRR